MKNLKINKTNLIQGLRKSRLAKPFSNRRGDDNAQEAGRGFVKTLGLVLVGAAALAILVLAVAGVNSGLDKLKTSTDSINSLQITNP